MCSRHGVCDFVIEISVPGRRRPSYHAIPGPQHWRSRSQHVASKGPVSYQTDCLEKALQTLNPSQTEHSGLLTTLMGTVPAYQAKRTWDEMMKDASDLQPQAVYITFDALTNDTKKET